MCFLNVIFVVEVSMSKKSQQKSKQNKSHASKKMSRKALEKISGGISVSYGGGRTNNSSDGGVSSAGA